MNRFWKYGILLILVLASQELILRFFFGNLAVGKLFLFHPGDGRCLGLRPGVEVLYTGHWLRTPPVKQDVNVYGYRGAPVPPAREATTTRRIAVIGDSFTYGVGVVNEDTFAFILQGRLRTGGGSTEVLNFGVPGLNLEEAIAQYQFFARRWKPDVVVFFLWNNDLDPPGCTNLWGRLFVPDTLIAGANELYVLRIPYVMWQSRSHKQREREDPAVAMHRLQEGLESFADRVRKDGASFGVAVLGNPVGRVNSPALQARLSAEAIPMVDLQPVFDDMRNRLPRDMHLSPRGHRLVAETVAEWLPISSLSMSSAPAPRP